MEENTIGDTPIFLFLWILLQGTFLDSLLVLEHYVTTEYPNKRCKTRFHLLEFRFHYDWARYFLVYMKDRTFLVLWQPEQGFILLFVKVRRYSSKQGEAFFKNRCQRLLLVKDQSLRLTSHSVGSTWGQVCFSQCLLSGIALNHPQQPWQRDQEGLWNRKKTQKYWRQMHLWVIQWSTVRLQCRR